MVGNDRYIIAAAAFFTAGKTTYVPRALSDVALASFRVRCEKTPELLQHYEDQRIRRDYEDAVLGAEASLLNANALGFQAVQVGQPPSHYLLLPEFYLFTLGKRKEDSFPFGSVSSHYVSRMNCLTMQYDISYTTAQLHHCTTALQEVEEMMATLHGVLNEELTALHRGEGAWDDATRQKTIVAFEGLRETAKNLALDIFRADVVLMVSRSRLQALFSNFLCPLEALSLSLSLYIHCGAWQNH